MSSYKTLDPQNMHQSIYDFSDHIEIAMDIGKSISLNRPYADIRNIVVAGMGGSAIGGDVVRTLAKYELNIPIVVSRNVPPTPGIRKKPFLLLITHGIKVHK